MRVADCGGCDVSFSMLGCGEEVHQNESSSVISLSSDIHNQFGILANSWLLPLSLEIGGNGNRKL
jgi:hypothetical protein